MTTVGKVLVTVTAAAALAFLGFAAITMVGGPNWDAEAAALRGYVIEEVEGEVPTWSVKTRRTGETVQQGLKSLPAAVVAAREHLRSQQQEKLGQLEQQVPAVQKAVNRTKQAIETDVQAMDRRVSALVQQLNGLNERIEQLSEEGLAKSREAQALRVEVEKRRQEVFRLQNLLAEVQTDRFRAEQQAKKLRELMIRLEGNLDRLERRRDLLKTQLGS